MQDGYEASKNGAAAEMLACWHLLQKGYEVYRPVYTTFSSDVVAIDRDRKIIRVEVKLSSLNQAGKSVNFSKRQSGKFDLLIIVTPDGPIFEKQPQELSANLTSNCVAPENVSR